MGYDVRDAKDGLCSNINKALTQNGAYTLYFNHDWPLTKPFSLVLVFCEHLTFSLSRELRVFSINNPSVPTHFLR